MTQVCRICYKQKGKHSPKQNQIDKNDRTPLQQQGMVCNSRSKGKPLLAEVALVHTRLRHCKTMYFPSQILPSNGLKWGYDG